MSTTTSEHTTPLSEIIVTRCHEGKCTASHTASWGQHNYCTTCTKEACEWCTGQIIDEEREKSFNYAKAEEEWNLHLDNEHRDMMEDDRKLGEEFNKITQNAHRLRMKKKKTKSKN